MRLHLEEGCAQCEETYRFWQKLAGFIQQDQEAEPPADAVRVAKAYISTVGLAASASESRSVRTARLVFDTFAQPLAGVRSTGVENRHLLYEAPPFTIDLHIDSHTEPEQLRLDGQIVEDGRTAPWTGDVRVSVSSANAQLCMTGVNELGEFQCQIARREDFNLAVTPRAGELILIPLKVHP